MGTLADRIIAELQSGVPIDDDVLAARLGAVRQAVNQACRRMEQQGLLVRRPVVGGKIVNRLVSSDDAVTDPVARRAPRRARASGLLTEDEVKMAVRDHLEREGYRVVVAWGRERGIDLEACKPTSRIVVEAKGEAGLQPQQVNYFLGAIGELVQRMEDPSATYALALPDNAQYRGLVSRLPTLVFERLHLTVYFVGGGRDDVCIVTAENHCR